MSYPDDGVKLRGGKKVMNSFHWRKAVDQCAKKVW